MRNIKQSVGCGEVRTASFEVVLQKIPGVLETEVDYTGGTTPNAVYEQVKTGRTGHAYFLTLSEYIN